MSELMTIARIYALEGEDHLDDVLKILQDEDKLAGVTVMRGIAGYGESGKLHTSSLLDLSLELPLVVEFYDEAERVERVIEKLQAELGLKHIISWQVRSH